MRTGTSFARHGRRCLFRHAQEPQDPRQEEQYDADPDRREQRGDRWGVEQLEAEASNTAARIGRSQLVVVRDETWAPKKTPGMAPMSRDDVTANETSPNNRWPRAAAATS